jgi:hypothetical protein
MKYQLAISIAAIQSIALLVVLPISSIAESAEFKRSPLQVSPRSLDRVSLSQPKQPTNVVDFPEVGLALAQPIGFTKATTFYGFEQSSSNSSVMLTKIPGPFAAVTKGFDKSTLAARGLSLLSKQSVKIDKQPGLLLQITQSAYGEKFQKWILVFGNDQSTKMITANFLDKNAANIGEKLKKILLAVTPSSSASTPTTSSLPFTITAVEGLSLVQAAAGAGKVAAFTKDGNIPVIDPTDPLFIVTPSLGDVPVGERKSFATRRLTNYPQTEIADIKSTSEIEIDNLPGLEIVANGRDVKSNSALTLYQVMLFPKRGGYVLMTGIVGDKQAPTYLKKFKTVAGTYRNNQK